jgi:hypothetical protein
LRGLLWDTARNCGNYELIEYTVKSWKEEDRKVDVYLSNHKECLSLLIGREDEKDKKIAAKILEVLDRYTEKRLADGVRLKINTATRKITASSSSIETALFLWIITQIQDTENCRICKMCGRVFRLGSQKTRQYCYVHSDAAIDYFNMKLRKKRKAEEATRFIVV